MRYEQQKRYKRSGKSIISMARKLAVIVWQMLSKGQGFDWSLREGIDSFRADAGSFRVKLGSQRVNQRTKRLKTGSLRKENDFIKIGIY
jgi:hypothetical protein